MKAGYNIVPVKKKARGRTGHIQRHSVCFLSDNINLVCAL